MIDRRSDGFRWRSTHHPWRAATAIGTGSPYRAMNAAALATYQAIRRDGTQKHVLALMQTRDDLYKYLDYYAYEAKLDQLFADTTEK